MFGISSSEFWIIVLVAVVLAGPKQLPDILRCAGRLYRKLNKIIRNFRQVIDDTMYDADRIADRLTDEKDE